MATYTVPTAEMHGLASVLFCARKTRDFTIEMKLAVQGKLRLSFVLAATNSVGEKEGHALLLVCI